MRHQFSNPFKPFAGCSLLPAGKHSGEAKVNEFVESAHGFAQDVERAMEDCLLAAGEFEHLAATRGIDGAIRMQNAEDDAISSVLQQQCGVAPHNGEVLGGIAEASGARTNHRHYRDAHAPLRLDQRCQRGREPSCRDGRAQLDAVSAAALGGQAVFYRGGNNLQQNAGHARTSNLAITIDPGAPCVECLSGIRPATDVWFPKKSALRHARVLGWRR